MNQCIAERKLLFSLKGSTERYPFVVRIFAPSELAVGEVDFKFDKGTSVCRVQIDGLPDITVEKVYGADSIQALELAVNVDPILKRLAKKYEFYFPTGEGYFDE